MRKCSACVSGAEGRAGGGPAGCAASAQWAQTTGDADLTAARADLTAARADLTAARADLTAARADW